METWWADWQLWRGVPFFVRAWYGCSDASASLTPEIRVRLAEPGGQTAPPRGLGENPFWSQRGSQQGHSDQLNVCLPARVCVCVLAEGLQQWSWDVKDDTCVSARKGVCCHRQWGWDWSASPLALISFSIPPLLLFLIGGGGRGQLLWAPSHSGAVSGWPLRNILGVFLECSVSLYNSQRAVEKGIIMVIKTLVTSLLSPVI